MKKVKLISIFVLLMIILFQIEGFCYSKKYALVIGNSNYKDAPLRNPANDAHDMALTLKKLGFSVIKKINITHQEMENAIRQFSKSIQPNDIALFYFTGHGVQVDGINYLLPIGTSFDSVNEIKYKSVAGNMVIDKLEDTGSRLNIIILDAHKSISCDIWG